MHIEEIKPKISTLLKDSLPGESSQKKMMAVPESKLRFDPKAKKLARKSGVLILLFQDNENIRFPLILRHEYKGAHSGQISLPGGRMERSDADITHTALREAEEEIGINSQHVQILGKLSELYIPVSNFLVYPTVGLYPSPPKFTKEEREVKKIFTPSLQDLLNRDLIKRKTIKISGTSIDTPYFDLEKQFVWGATAMILSEFSTVLNQTIDTNHRKVGRSNL